MKSPHSSTLSSQSSSKAFGVTLGASDIGKADSYFGVSDIRWKKLYQSAVFSYRNGADTPTLGVCTVAGHIQRSLSKVELLDDRHALLIATTFWFLGVFERHSLLLPP